MMVVVMVMVLFWVFLLWVVVATIVVVRASGGCFGFFAVGCGCHNGAGGGERGWWLAEVPICGFLVVPVCEIGRASCRERVWRYV